MTAVSVEHKKEMRIVPKVRFPEFEGALTTYKLGDIALNGFNNGVFNDPKKVGEGYRLINVKDMYIGDKIDISSLTLLNLDDKEFSRNKVEHGDIFFTRSSLVKEGIAHSNVFLNDKNDVTYDGHLIRMRPNQSLAIPSYLACQFQTSTLRKQFIIRGKTTTMTTIGQEDVTTVQAIIPSLPEQQKIAAFLSAVDKKIQQLTRKKELLEQYKKGMMQKIFSQEIRFKREDGSDYPAWEENLLGDVATFTKGKGLSKSDVVIDGQLLCIRYGELYTLYSEVVSEICSSTNVDLGELVLSKTNDVIIPSSGETNIDIATASCVMQDGIALGGDINIIRTSQNGVFLAYYLNNAKKIDIARLAQGNCVVHLYSTHLKTLKVSIPDKKEQNKVADFLRKMSRKIQAIQNQLTQAQQFKKGLLQQMFV